MSKIQAKPYIEKVVATLSEEQKTSLLSLINGSNQTPAFRSLVNANNLITGADKGVSHIVLETWNKTYTGYLLYNDTYCVLVAYSNNTQELNIVKINLANRTYNLVKEVLSILEFRVVLGGGGSGGGIPDAIEVNNITDLSDDQIDGLKPGDLVIKKTGNQKHTYLVTYKEANQGICLTYTDASISETVSYDYSGGHWVYNSTDVTELGGDGTVEVVELTGLSGTLSDSDYTKVSADNCVLKLGTQYFYKAFNASTLIVYQAFSRQAGQDSALFDYVEITKADKTWELKADNIVEANPTVPGGTTPTALDNLKIGNSYYKVGSLAYLTTAPDSDNTEGLKIVVLSQEPATYYDGYLYLIQDSQV